MLHANSSRIQQQLQTLSSFNSDPSQPGITRMLFSKEEIEARNYVKSLMKEAGLSITEDAVGNIFGTLKGTNPSLAPVWSGSHIDTVINAGKYDGTIGVIGAIEACRMIKEAGLSHERDITAIVYTSEEPTRFGVGCLGSRALAGHLSIEEAKEMRGDDGISLYDLLTSLSYDADALPSLKKNKGDVYACVELHIEQAPILDEKEIPIGIVEGICAPSYLKVSVAGVQEHAGSTPMTVRKDALCAAAQIILALEEMAKKLDHPNAVATVGKLQVFPNASNVIPGQVDFSIDIRDFLEERKTELTESICRFMDKLAQERGVSISYQVTADDLPCTSAPSIVALLEETCKERNIPYHNMISGAYHDTLLVASFAPVAMIFVPSKNGISHDPAEFTELSHIVLGTEVLADSLYKLANQQ